MPPQPDPTPDDDGSPPARPVDEAKSVLDQLELRLKRTLGFLGSLFAGFFLFFFQRLPKWTYEVVREFVRRISHYLGQVGRIVMYTVLVVVLMVALAAMLVGIPYGLYAVGTPIVVPIVVAGLEVVAILFAVQRYLWKKWKKYRARKAQQRAQVELPVCAVCGVECVQKSPTVCPACGEPWRGLKV